MESRNADIESKALAWLSQINLFLISYAALSFIFAIRLWPNHVASGIFGLVGAYGIFSAWRMLANAQNRPRRIFSVKTIEDQGNAVAGYLATYLLPFLGGMPDGWNDWAAYGIYFFVAFVVFSKSSLGLVNPTLYALGWRVYYAEVNGNRSTLISKRVLRDGDEVKGSRLRGRVLVVDSKRRQD